ncbi:MULTISPECIES: sensor histidine kinase [unclassified Streptomyces]|uniref:sensor histidine kinase n=1 Tax=unclassified Streptomyces TaxID=2593676 RepID=UPI001C223DC6|nr:MULTISPECIES: sensor histidine kinase [unclassified Streptomyces]MBU8550545.1 sensor histidine kinase [Streptomyces sp. Osf17]MBU8557321.1 sensor histidine kinase [Streptomyces sp. Babs14]
MEHLSEEKAADPLTEHAQRLVRRVRAFDRRRPLVWDLLLTGFWMTAALIDYSGGGWRSIAHNLDVPGPLLLAMSLGFTIPLLWRRTHPAAVLLAMVPVALVNAWTGAVLQAAMLQLLVVFHIALRLPLRALCWATPLVLAQVLVTGLRHGESSASWNQQFGSQLLSLGVAALIGVTVRTRRNYTAALEDRARRLETERDQQARIAAAAERARIAREMHDIIGHNLSVITGLADGGRYAAAKSPERAAQALDAIGSTSRQALGELRRLLDVLREDAPGRPHSAELAPQPSLTDLAPLVDGVRRAGLPVRTTVHGRPDLPAGRQLAVYRVIQEALTNTLKHAGPDATADIQLRYGEGGSVTLTVTDTGRAVRSGSPGDGRGLPGMRERTALYGGTLEAGPRPHPERGWRVHLHLPEETPQ